MLFGPQRTLTNKYTIQCYEFKKSKFILESKLIPFLD